MNLCSGIKVTTGVLLAMVLAAALFGGSLVETLLQHLIEARGTAITGVPVNVARVNVQGALSGGRVEVDLELQGLVVGNPPDYVSPYAFQAKRLRARFNLGALFDPITILREAEIDGFDMNYEEKDSLSNFEVISRAIGARDRNDASDQHQTSGSVADESSRRRIRYIVEPLSVRDFNARLHCSGKTREEHINALELAQVVIRHEGLPVAGIVFELLKQGPWRTVKIGAWSKRYCSPARAT